MQEGDPFNAAENLIVTRKPLLVAYGVERLLHLASEEKHLKGKARRAIAAAMLAAKELQRSIVNVSRIYRLTADMLEQDCSAENRFMCAHKVKQICDYLVRTKSNYTVEIDDDTIKQVIPVIYWIRKTKKYIDSALMAIDADDYVVEGILMKAEYALDDLEMELKHECLWLKKAAKDVLTNTSDSVLRTYADQLKKAADFFVR